MNPVTAAVEKKAKARHSAQMEEFQRRLTGSPAAQAARAFFATPSGMALMQHLEAAFYDGELLGEDDRETNFNLGAREVVKELRKLRDAKERTGDDASQP